LPHPVLKAIGKSVLLTTGFAWGVCAIFGSKHSAETDQKEWDEIEGRLDRIERAIGAVAAAKAAPAANANYVTRDELATKLEQVRQRIEGEVDAKLETQSLSVEALRTMIRHTDSLLERVLGMLGEAHEKETEEEPISISTE
jgi:hypothetical protein